MEAKSTKEKQNIVIKVEEGSIAEEVGIEVGDILLRVNDTPIYDVFDYRYLMDEEYVEIELLSKDGEEYIAEIEKEPEEDIGIIFESGLMDKAKRCSNQCIFCFIDQLPKGMRETLYFKDDDSRLSFLQGNYVTLTNMPPKDIDRIVYYHLSPINISVHTTDLELRKKMLKNKNAGNLLDIMKKFADAGIDMNLQVVLCKNINDGAFLEKTIKDCAAFYPRAKSMSVVPIGLTKYRDNLYPMEPFLKEDAKKVLSQIEKWQKKLKKEIGTHFVFASDEFYLKAKMPFPSFESYEEFSQYENGVGMIAYMKWEFEEEMKKIPPLQTEEKTVSVATGKAAFSLIKDMAGRLEEKIGNLKIHVYEIENEFFGKEITVSGLLTGQDIIKQLKEKELGQYLLLPDSLLRNGTTTLLDDMEIKDIERALKVPVKITLNSASSFIGNIVKLEEIKNE